MQRYFVQPEQFQEDKVVILGDDVHHVTKVMRFKPGDSLICADGQGLEVLAEIILIQQKQVVCKIISKIAESREPRLQLILAQAIPKSDKMDWIIQKGTEIGVSAFIPFTSKRTVVQLNEKKEQKRLERWHKIAKEAAEQAHRGKIPTLFSVMEWKEVLEIAKDNFAIIAYEQEKTQSLARILDQHLDKYQHIMLMVGPEGGFTEEEIEEAKAYGIVSVSLGKRILRTETAGMVAAANIFYHVEQLDEKG